MSLLFWHPPTLGKGCFQTKGPYPGNCRGQTRLSPGLPGVYVLPDPLKRKATESWPQTIKAAPYCSWELEGLYKIFKTPDTVPLMQSVKVWHSSAQLLLFNHLSSSEEPNNPSVQTAVKAFVFHGQLCAHLQHNVSLHLWHLSLSLYVHFLCSSDWSLEDDLYKLVVWCHNQTWMG